MKFCSQGFYSCLAYFIRNRRQNVPVAVRTRRLYTGWHTLSKEDAKKELEAVVEVVGLNGGLSEKLGCAEKEHADSSSMFEREW
jgi:hypothetical protein